MLSRITKAWDRIPREELEDLQAEKVRIYRPFSVIVVTLGVFLTGLLIAWDFAIDPIGAWNAIIYRIAVMVTLALLAAYLHFDLWPRFRTHIFVLAMVISQSFLFLILAELENGFLIGSGAVLFWFIFLPLVSMGLTLRSSILGIIALSTAPIFWYFLGFTPDILIDVFIMYTWSSGSIIAIILIVNDRLILQSIRDRRDLTIAKEKAEILARTDSLSGMNNRRAFFDLGKTTLQTAIRYERSFSLITLDIDHFKQINDSYGHAIGDIAIKEVANTIAKVIRTTDISGRIGGEEFAIILPETSLNSAHDLAERLRLSIEEIEIPLDNANLTFTASLGVVELMTEFPTLNETLNRADTALYKAKEQGRNRVVIETKPRP
ncbi:MAG: GGDEF domain-containing protein [Rhodospirillales bacterium]|nr:GGDEF domain-containing protein [Rhodospirillales bacterium]